MSEKEGWKPIVASSLDWEQAHMSLENAVAGLAPELRSKKPTSLPHSVWDIVEHIRIAQHDLLDFCTNADYHHDLVWPDDYWPKEEGSVSDADWNRSIAEFKREREELKAFATEKGRDLTAMIPTGTGQT
ncbi:MAG TPA: DinB family protein, partial [Gemmatimonadaceae bacterium]|nr:DinB family protein [Gemmatimonadaceae bacterium]